MVKTVSIDSALLGSPRLTALAAALRTDRCGALGALVLFWAASRALGNQDLARDQLRVLAAQIYPRKGRALLNAMVAHGFLLRRDNGTFVVPDDADYHRQRAARRRAGQASAAARAAPPAKAPVRAARKASAKQRLPVAAARVLKATPSQVQLEHHQAAWAAYSEAYRERYGVDPVRNARVNSLVKQFVARIGAEESPGVLRFFCEHSNQHYTLKMHALNVALVDAEALRSQWKTGQKVTATKARQEDVQSSRQTQWDDIVAGKLL